MLFVSSPFQLDRKQFVSVATKYYLQRYAITYVALMILGATLIAFQPNGFGLVIGLIMVVYPLSVPVRYGNAVARQARNLFDRDMTYELWDDEIVIRMGTESATRARYDSARARFIVKDHLLMVYGRSGFLILPLDPLPKEAKEWLTQKLRL